VPVVVTVQDLDDLPPDEDFDDWYYSTPFSADELKSQQICKLLALLRIYDILQKSGDLRMPDWILYRPP
jgi:hypothetical protein